MAIGFSGVLNHLTLPPLTRAVRARHPHLAITLAARTTTSEAINQIRSGGLDLAFVGLPVDPDLVASRLIAVEDLGVVVPVDHPLAGAGRVELVALADECATPAGPGGSTAAHGCGCWAATRTAGWPS